MQMDSKNTILLIIIIFTVYLYRFPVSCFKVFWNIPTQNCLEEYGVAVNVTKYGIIENKEDGWKGKFITIFTPNEMGFLPYIAENGSMIHGGVPQLANLTAHLAQCRKDIDKYIPNQNFSGLGIIDYEAWRLAWMRNFDSKEIYRNISMELVRQEHPNWSPEEIEKEAQAEFESAGWTFFRDTLRLASTLRPLGQWGYYGYPDYYNGKGSRQCPNNTLHCNDRILWLFRTSSAIYPSAYVYDSSNHSRNLKYVFGTIKEAIRVRSELGLLAGTKPIYLYNRIRYRNPESWLQSKDLDATLGQARKLGLEGSVIWDDHYLSDSRATCLQTQHYLTSTLGPYVQRILLQKEVKNNNTGYYRHILDIVKKAFGTLQSLFLTF